MSGETFNRDDYCFACGADNPVGLQLKPEAADGRSTTHWTPRPEHQGFEGVLHGGIIATLLDEAMAFACLSVVRGCATAEMQTRFLKPVATALPVTIEARVAQQKRKLLWAEAELHQAGELMATATAKFVQLARPGKGK